MKRTVNYCFEEGFDLLGLSQLADSIDIDFPNEIIIFSVLSAFHFDIFYSNRIDLMYESRLTQVACLN